ncbi:MAG: DNA repair protein RecO [Flavobacteriales bacterium]|nr:DNA repair protein RecO [Flavobacteriales bacterium]MCB9191781.1 DNA repair protein RecO [Flavobacteriales bacterium]MCB9203557.1 DNA repair protein RecO [Flavobacteriales bacterium]
MILNSSGIVLSTLRYSDSSVIARVYTRRKGLRSFMVRTGKGKNALPKLAMLQPLSIVEISFQDDERKNLHTLRSIERESALKSIPFEPLKTCIALFVAELISKSIEEEEGNEELYKFLHNAVLLLDDDTQEVSNFHLKFMVEFTRFLGFYPQHSELRDPYFDLIEGEFVTSMPIHAHYLGQHSAGLLTNLMQVGMSAYAKVRIQNEHRRELLQKLIEYYRLHLDGMKEIKSHRVLEEVLS